MDEFDDEYPDFDWRSTPSEKHDKKCLCPKCEELQEIRKSRNVKMCPDHYQDFMEYFFNESDNFLEKLMLKLILKLRIVKIIELSHMESGLCHLCKFDDDDGGQRNDIVPAPEAF